MMNLTKRFKRFAQLLPSTTKLLRGNVFSRMCLFTGGGSHVTNTNDILSLIAQGLPLGSSPSPDMGLHCTGTPNI